MYYSCLSHPKTHILVLSPRKIQLQKHLKHKWGIITIIIIPFISWGWFNQIQAFINDVASDSSPDVYLPPFRLQGYWSFFEVFLFSYLKAKFYDLMLLLCIDKWMNINAIKMTKLLYIKTSRSKWGSLYNYIFYYKCIYTRCTNIHMYEWRTSYQFISDKTLDFLDKESKISSNSFLLGKYTSQIKIGTVLQAPPWITKAFARPHTDICIHFVLTGSC